MRSFLVGLTVTISLSAVLHGPASAQNSGMPQVVRGASADSKKTSTAKAPVQRREEVAAESD